MPASAETAARFDRFRPHHRLYAVECALRDVQATLNIWRDEKPLSDPYMKKLWAEFDEFSLYAQELRHPERFL